ncbi:MAG: AbrB/MazE/SpoVT family DNA-binding domain-containing protein [Nitriliruptorales bacterium]
MMTGIRRKVDDLGRVVIPAGIRRALGIREGDPVEVHVEGERIVLSRPTDQCVFCRSEHDLRLFRHRSVCGSCVAAIGLLDGADAAPADGGQNAEDQEPESTTAW